VVKAACVMHNYLRRNSTIITENEEDEVIENFPTDQLLPLSRNPSRCVKKAFLVRQKFTEYFNSIDGSVNWQDERIAQGQY